MKMLFSMEFIVFLLKNIKASKRVLPSFTVVYTFFLQHDNRMRVFSFEFKAPLLAPKNNPSSPFLSNELREFFFSYCSCMTFFIVFALPQIEYKKGLCLSFIFYLSFFIFCYCHLFHLFFFFTL